MADIELIAGPAGCGKTARVFRAFREEVAARQAEGRFGTTLWITPAERSRRQVMTSLLDERLSVCLGPGVLTFDEFAETVLRAAPVPVRPLSRIAKRKLLRDLIDDLKRRRRLRYFGAVAETVGFLDLCVSFISELKREEVWPEDFESACRAAGDGESKSQRANPKDRELALIYDAYQRRLHAGKGAKPSRDASAQFYDAEGRFWSARTLMRQGHRGPFRDLTLVVVDGFTDFTRTQYEMLAELAEWAGRMMITLPLDGSERRDGLFAKSAAALRDLRVAFGDRHRLAEIELDLPPEFAATAFGRISAGLFTNPREVVRAESAEGISVLSCVRRTGEVEEIARRVKRLLVGGTPADDIVVAFRSLEGVADMVREAFADAGIPAAVECGPMIAKCGSVRLLTTLLDLERENWSFPRLMAVLNSTLFRPEWPGVGDGSAARAVGAVLRSFNLEGGREVMLASLARRVESRAGDPEFTLAAETLRRLSDGLASLRKPSTFAEWVDDVLYLATSLRIAPQVDDRPVDGDGTPIADEANAWDAFVRLAEEAKKAESLAGGPAPVIGLAEFRGQFDELLSGQRWESGESEAGAVRVLAADRARHLEVAHLFLCGLSEASFPQSHREDCFYGEAERLRLTESGVTLADRARRSREEMLLFYGVVTRARRSLTLTFPSVDDGGGPLYPSPYLAALRDLFTPDSLPAETCGRLDPVPESPEECVTEGELRVLATHQILAGRPALFAAFAERAESSQVALNIASAAEMTAARFATRGLTNYEGLLSDPRNIKRLRKRFGGGHEFSATELETYASHPFRFFLCYVLGLKPQVDPGPATDFAGRGSAAHAALAATHRRLAEQVAGALSADVLDQMLRSEVQAALPGGGDSPLQRALRRIERDVLTSRAARYVPQWEQYHRSFQSLWDSPPRPVHLEVAFGNAPDEEGESSSDAPGVRHPVVEFGRNGAAVRVRGRIDRIDIGTAEGRPVFNVIDYKLGAPPRFCDDDVCTGRALQLAVYACAARRLGIVDANLYQLAFWSLSGDGFVCGLKTRQRGIRPLEPEVVAALEESLDHVLPQLADAIRSGRFPVVSDDPDEPYHADYAAVARTGQFRSVAEILEKTSPVGNASPQAASSSAPGRMTLSETAGSRGPDAAE